MKAGSYLCCSYHNRIRYVEMIGRTGRLTQQLTVEMVKKIGSFCLILSAVVHTVALVGSSALTAATIGAVDMQLDKG